jgi:hypothetical protein
MFVWGRANDTLVNVPLRLIADFPCNQGCSPSYKLNCTDLEFSPAAPQVHGNRWLAICTQGTPAAIASHGPILHTTCKHATCECSPAQAVLARNMHVKHFKGIPLADLEMVMPEKHIYVPPSALVQVPPGGKVVCIYFWFRDALEGGDLKEGPRFVLAGARPGCQPQVQAPAISAAALVPLPGAAGGLFAPPSTQVSSAVSLALCPHPSLLACLRSLATVKQKLPKRPRGHCAAQLHLTQATN